MEEDCGSACDDGYDEGHSRIVIINLIEGAGGECHWLKSVVIILLLREDQVSYSAYLVDD